jgi:hypothetical protein
MFDKVINTDKKMTITSKQIVDSLYKIMSTYIKPNKDEKKLGNGYFKRRIGGFKAEIEFENLVAQQGAKFLEGGQFISQFTNPDGLSRFLIYTTVSFDNPSDYIELYSQIAQWDEVNEMYYMQITNDEWGNEEFTVKKKNGKKVEDSILTPSFKIYTFNKTTNLFIEQVDQGFDEVTKRFTVSTKQPSRSCLRNKSWFNYFFDYDLECLKKIYANRYFLDVILKKFTKKKSY